jgi:hypothetical protein
MTHIYNLHGFAPRSDWLRWSCRTCGRTVDQDRQTGRITVQVSGTESVIHGGHAGQHHIFDIPEVGAFEVGGPVGRFLSQLEG